MLLAATSVDREGLLMMLEASLAGVSAPIPDQEEVDAYEEGDEHSFEEEEEELDEEDEELLDATVSAPAQLTDKGEDMLFVSGAIERWLGRCPQGPLTLGLAGARALGPMVLFWSATLTHALAYGSQNLEELQRTLGSVLEPDAVEIQLKALVNSGQAEAVYGSGRGSPTYALTDWGREAISPIVAAVRYEQRYPEEDVLAPDVFDVEAAFQMALPLIEVPPGARGTVRAGVLIPGEEELIAGSTVQVADGRIAAASPLLDRVPETWATGTPLDWCETVIDPEAEKLQAAGDSGVV